MITIKACAVRRSGTWAASNPTLVEAYIRGYVAGVDFLRDDRNKDYACAVLRKHLPEMSNGVAAQTYAAITGVSGFSQMPSLMSMAYAACLPCVANMVIRKRK